MNSIARKAPVGILGFPVAPMDQNGRLVVSALEKNIQFLIDEGLSSIFIACGSGEFHALSNIEYQTMVETAISVAKGKVPVYTGVGGNISHALELTKLSKELGANGYLILPPYLIEPEQEGLCNYLSTIIESTDLNAIVYQRDNCVLTLPTLQKLVENPQLVGFKDGLGNMDTNIELTQTIGDRLGWLNGMPMAEVTMPAYVNMGFTSYSSAISNYIPHISATFYQALLSQNKSLLNELYLNVILPINRIRRQKKGYAVALIKAGMEIVGLPVGTQVRAPIVQVEKDHYQQMEQIIKVAFDKFPKDKK
ncbi:5-dehydro-4-deoxyglucarate dehydratase [Paenibacillus sp. LMG 31456]|uniref:Probable 5-dehydro-4-deoxyglucarate dehydratase n=1 Tax=Paenibacillus foliorum TaxID=2654974 RepID=A0A972K3T0_9BACL|nr:5-dehydro-4-deoxyglucarate dehydratase [Paenibacillus foliorum]NOU97300.1 5-dehydro-4-deoxyglucarate dehydratase [Paenibacillus foliorum]